ncbi:MAG: methylmalonyl Co-A mutase-associated GTPase MeaB [Rhodospirillaceae bacterium]|nr:methylmalonyl Co-A mutase-associated GTPase MeaB [Rhodospirillaceae bacterium]|tara:strand:+ start:88 stop:1083 length:996 start_codon:yes stop_codon:yes gene_type:complete
MSTGKNKLVVADYINGIRSGDRTVLARGITLVESALCEHRAMAETVLTELLPEVKTSIRIGVTGVPGVGKSTFIEAFGRYLTTSNHKVAVLAVDPTSTRTGGSILGDKTRMLELSRDTNAFIRPSPTSGTLGGVTRATRETITLCEAAGFNVILVETVGVGQSEISVAGMVDFFLALMLPGAGDELQGIKKGLLEIADMIAVNKADGDMITAARRAALEYEQALHILQPMSPNWIPSSLVCSALTGDGLPEIWKKIENFKKILETSGEWQKKRQEQRINWMWSMIRERLMVSVEKNKEAQALAAELELDVKEQKITPGTAALKVLAAANIR